MAKVRIVLTETLKKYYRKLPYEIQEKFDKQYRFLHENPCHPSLKIHQIKGSKGFWEFYVDYRYRGVFRKEAEVYIIEAVGCHSIIEKYAKKK
ncbi:MAG: DNA helicase [Thermodesulfobacteriota bacterium]